MTLTQLRYLVAIAESGLNITLAAERVHVTQPGLSKQLRQLEDELGFQLFIRKGRSLVAVTQAGETVIAHARRALDATGDIRSFAADERGDHAGELILATTHTQARFVLPAAIARIKQAFPQVGVHLQAASDGEVLEQLASGAADMAVISTAGTVPDGGLAVPLFSWRRMVLVPRGHLLATRDRTPTLAELATFPLISYESSTRQESSLRRAFTEAGHEPQLAMTARDADLIKTYVRAGIGVGVLAEMALNDADDNLIAWPAPPTLPECITWAVIPRTRILRRYALELIHELAPQIDRHDLRRVIDGNQAADWPEPPSWVS